MAKYKIEFDGNKVTKTLTFMDKEFTEEWEVQEYGNWECPCGLEAKVERVFPYLPDDVEEIIATISCMEEYEVPDALERLTDHEAEVG